MLSTPPKDWELYLVQAGAREQRCLEIIVVWKAGSWHIWPHTKPGRVAQSYSVTGTKLLECSLVNLISNLSESVQQAASNHDNCANQKCNTSPGHTWCRCGHIACHARMAIGTETVQMRVQNGV